jgi:hypothetical protein
MFLLKFQVKNEGKIMLLHDGESFVGGNTYQQAEYASINNSAKAVSVGGFDIVEMTEEELLKVVGGIPYKILAVHGGLIPFNGVEIKEK